MNNCERIFDKLMNHFTNSQIIVLTPLSLSFRYKLANKFVYGICKEILVQNNYPLLSGVQMLQWLE